MMSARGSRPKISSESWTEPAALPSRVVTFSSISRALLLGRRFRSLLAAGHLELAGLRRFLWQRLLHRIAHRDPSALGAGNGAFDQDQAALHVGLHHAQIERGDAIDAHVAGHLLVLLGRAMAQHLAIAELEHGHRDMFAGLRKDPRHPDLLCDHSGAHRRASCSFCPLEARTGSKNQSLISTSTPAARSSFIRASTV